LTNIIPPNIQWVKIIVFILFDGRVVLQNLILKLGLIGLFFLLVGMLNGCHSPWNSPYSETTLKSNTLFAAFSSPPKHLDPVVSYNANEWGILSQVMEPPLQYHYFKRPYTLEPLLLAKMPQVTYLNEQNQMVDKENHVAYSVYTFEIKKSIQFQNHPCFVKNKQGQLVYQHLTAAQLKGIQSPSDFPQKATRTLTAHDFVYAIQRMAIKQNHSPILGTMEHYIVGLKTYSNNQSKQVAKNANYAFRNHPISGVKVLSDTQFQIKIKGIYPQFLYWLSMNFFAPVPWEAVEFYKQPALKVKNISLDTFPVGTGPYELVENNPNQRMRLVQNPNYHHGFYPADGLPKTANPALLADAGKPLPFIHQVIFTLEKESVPLWNKFLQGYYDSSGVSSDSFDQAMNLKGGQLSLTPQMKRKGIQFLNTIEPSIFYLGFNMADPVVGGYSEKQQKLRRAISLAINEEEYISIFMNGRGVASQGPIPPGVLGYESGARGINPYLYTWQHHRAIRKPLSLAKKWLAEAGYPNGKLPNGKPLTLYYDTAATGPDSQAVLNWYRKQFKKLGIELVIRGTDYNRFQDKVRKASVQLFSWGWNADYPDPENFLFLLAGENAVINTQGTGINAANYDNPEFNQLFKQIKKLPNSPKRLQLIRQAIHLVQKEAPWDFGFSPKSLVLYHQWLGNVWPNPLANNTLKYKKIDDKLRLKQIHAWNPPILWPFILVFAVLILSIYPLMKAYQKRQQRVIQPKDNDHV